MGLKFANTRALRLSAGLCCILAAAPTGLSHAQPGTVQIRTTDRLIVRFADPQAAGEAEPDPGMVRVIEQTAGVALRPLRHASGGTHVLKLERAVTLDEARRMSDKIQTLTPIRYAQPDRRYRSQLIPDDPEYPRQWYMGSGGIGAESAWDLTTGNQRTVVAVLDSGILAHTELGGRLLAGYDFITDIDTANDGDARDPDPADPGDFVTEEESNNTESIFFDCEVADSSWHGTFIAGLIGANTNNGRGIAGIDHRADILPVRVLGKCGGFVSDVADALRWAAGVRDPALPDNANPAAVINLSFGAEGECSQTEQAAIDDAVEAGALVVVAAGNSAAEVADFAPANCENVVTVAAATRQGGESSYTNFGEAIDISAPGGNTIGPDNPGDGILSLSNTGARAPAEQAYEFGYGTSFAAPMVSGAAALVLSVDPTLSPTDLRLLLLSSIRPFPTGTTDGFGDCTTSRCGAGLVDARAAVAAADNGTLGGRGNGRIRMALDSICTTEDDTEITVSAVRESGSGPVAVRLKSQRISATPDSDYQSVDDILMWQEGDSGPKSKTISISPDNIVEGSEFFAIRLVDASAAVEVGSPDATVITIVSTNGNTPKSCGAQSSSNGGGDSGGGNISPLFFIVLLMSALRGTRRRSA